MGLVTLTFDRLTLKLVCQSHLRRRTFLPKFGTLGLWVLELFSNYATDRRTDESNVYCPPSLRGRSHTKIYVQNHDQCLLATYLYLYAYVKENKPRDRSCMFLSRVSILTRDIDIANLFVCPFVRPSLCLSVTFWYQMKTA